MREEIDFSKTMRLTPRNDSWATVVARLEAKQEEKRFILFRKISSVAVAASVVLVAGAFFLGMNAGNISISQELTSDSTTESLSWYSTLGSGESVSTFATAFDNYYSIGE